MTWWQDVDAESFSTVDDRTIARISAGAAYGVYRQCSIGHHLECSDPAGEECACPCHLLLRTMLSGMQSEGLVP